MRNALGDCDISTALRRQGDAIPPNVVDNKLESRLYVHGLLLRGTAMSGRCSFASPSILRSLRVKVERSVPSLLSVARARTKCSCSLRGIRENTGDKNVLARALAGDIPVHVRCGRTAVIHVDASEHTAIALCSRKSRITLSIARGLGDALVRAAKMVCPSPSGDKQCTGASKTIMNGKHNIAVEGEVSKMSYVLAVTGGANVAPAARDWLLRNGFALEFCVVDRASNAASKEVAESHQKSNRKISSVPASFSDGVVHSSTIETEFRIVSPYEPRGDQPAAIEALVKGLTGSSDSILRKSSHDVEDERLDGDSVTLSQVSAAKRRKPRRFMTLAGVTGSGKSFICANVIARLGKPALILAPNKILAAQLCDELRQYLPYNSVNYFVSYYSYFQPESYLPASDTFIAKSSAIDQDIDRLRHLATRSLVERNDVVVVASVSCIYGIGLPADYLRAAECFECGRFIIGGVATLSDRLKELRYTEIEGNQPVGRGEFYVAHISDDSSFVNIGPPWEKDGFCYRIRITTSCIDDLAIIDEVRHSSATNVDRIVLYPASHFVSPSDRLKTAMECIKREKDETVRQFMSEGKVLEAHRVDERVSADLDMLNRVGFCSGIENYTMHMSGRDRDEPPDTLLDFFPSNGEWILFVDESHVTVPQLGAMYNGNLARKKQLVRYGFRLPSAVENRPLSFNEFWEKIPQAVFLSATPGKFELENCLETTFGAEPSPGPCDIDRGVVEAVIRPTGIVDPSVEVVRTKGQMDHLMNHLARTVARGERALITTLTKKGAEDLAAYIEAQEPMAGILNRRLKANYLHSGIDAVGRMEILDAIKANFRSLDVEGNIPQPRNNSIIPDDITDQIDVLCGVNLLREGISLPCVSLVAVLDADKEGFLRSSTALIQTIGRAARNVNGHVILYGDRITAAMRYAVEETNRRRTIQAAHNSRFGVCPTTILSAAELKRRHVETLLDQIRREAQEKGITFRSGGKSFEKSVKGNVRYFDKEALKGFDHIELRARMDAAIKDEDFEMAAAVRDMLGL